MKPRRLPSLALTLTALAALGMARPPAQPTATPAPTPATAPTPTSASTVAMPLPTPLVIGDDSRPFKDAPEALGITVEGGENSDDENDNSLTATTEFTIQFPDAMVSPDRIDATDSPSPFPADRDLAAASVDIPYGPGAFRRKCRVAWRVHRVFAITHPRWTGRNDVDCTDSRKSLRYRAIGEAPLHSQTWHRA